MSDHDTKEVGQLATIRSLLERQAAKADALEAKADAHRAEGARRGEESTAKFKSLESAVEAVKVETQRLNMRMTEAEKDIRGLRDGDVDLRRTQSDSDLSHQAALGGAIAHVRTLGESLEAIRVNDEKQNRVHRAICLELGLDYEAISASDEPTSKNALKKTTLHALARENKASTLSSALAFLIVVIQLAMHLLGVKH